MAMPKHYNLISELRKKPLAKAQIGAMLRQGPVVATKINVLEDLKADNIIDEFEYQGMTYVMLKTDIIIVDQFPEYMQKALPEKERISRIPRHFNLPQVPVEVRDDLKDLFGDDDLLIGQMNEATAKEPKPLQPPAPEKPSTEAPLIEDSPFDMIVDKMTTKFITSKGNDPDRVKTNPDGTEPDRKQKE
jgi:hypothetical protein